MRIALKVVTVLVAGVALGLAATWLVVIKGGTLGGSVSDGPWSTSLDVGSSASDPWLRARIAVHGLLALNRSETIYYTARTDSAGAALSSACVYRVEGKDPPTRWWSITAYGGDDFLIPNPAGIYSASQNSVHRGANGRFAIAVSRERVAGDWIPVGDGPFSLSIRLYNPDASVTGDPAHAPLPAIVKERCA